MGIAGGGAAAAVAAVEGTLDAASSSIPASASTNYSASSESHFNSSSEMPQIPSYIRTTSMFFCITIMILGVIGNVMVPIVILKTKDMRNSTNIFLTNLSIADLLVLLVCTPTVLVEVNTRPETWVLGQEMCKAVPFVELTVAHASVLTILAISFERYYAICEPLKAGYVCTKTRALLICVFAWGVAALFTSPILWVAEYKYVEYVDGSDVAVCLTQAVTSWTIGFFLMTISIFFILPLIILIVLYGIIAKNLISKDGPMMKIRPTKPEFSLKARKQVVMMLGAVVLSFFLCLLPFRVLTMWIILSSDQTFFSVGVERYYNLLYFSRIMLYLNSAINPILYNLMSTKFRKGFLKLCICCKPLAESFQFRHRTATLNTTTTSSSFLSRSSNRRTSDDLKNRVALKIDLHQQLPECEVGMLSKCDSSIVIDDYRKLSLANTRRKLSSVDNDNEDEGVIDVTLMGDTSTIATNANGPKARALNCRIKCKRQISFDENVIVNSERGANGERIVYQTSLEDKICGSKKDTSVINFLPTKNVRNSIQNPILLIASYQMETYFDGSEVAVCVTSADTFWTAFYFIGSISLFFLLPFVILLVLYTIIAWNLMGNPGIISQHHHQRHHEPPAEQPPSTMCSQNHHHHRSNVLKYRKQVIFMLVAVVLSFFLCLLPFRAFTLWIILMPPESIVALGIEGYYNLLYFCRIMLYLNSALNPILYNLMSSKFRDGFLRLLGCDTSRGVALKSMDGMRKGTFHTNSTNLSTSSSSMRREAIRGSSVRSRTDSVTVSLGGELELRRDSISNGIQMNSAEETSVVKKKASRRQHSFDDIEELEETEEPNAGTQSVDDTSYSVRDACVTPFLLQKAITDRCCRAGTYQ